MNVSIRGRFFWTLMCIFLAGFGLNSGAHAATISITLTPTALGLGTIDAGSSPSKVNYGSEILPDQNGLKTAAPGVGGSYLEINGSGLADDAANGDHLVTITSETHDDVIQTPSISDDYYFGVITLTDQGIGSGSGSGSDAMPPTPDPSNLGGLGLRAFEDVDSKGDRIIGSGGNWEIGGSKEVSGGTDDPNRDLVAAANGAPHVDEVVKFNFDGDYQVGGESLEILLTKVKFGNDDAAKKGLRVALQVSVLGKGELFADDASCSMSQLDPTGNCKIYESLNDTLVLTTDANGNITVHFDEIAELEAGDIITMVRISALDDDVEENNLKTTAEHFLINGLTGDFTRVPEPSTAALMLVGLSGLAWAGRRSRLTR